MELIVSVTVMAGNVSVFLCLFLVPEKVMEWWKGDNNKPMSQ